MAGVLAEVCEVTSRPSCGWAFDSVGDLVHTLGRIHDGHREQRGMAAREHGRRDACKGQQAVGSPSRVPMYGYERCTDKCDAQGAECDSAGPSGQGSDDEQEGRDS